jgi:hypothetical protein
MAMPDGSFLIKPLKPILRATATRTSALTGISLKNLRILADVGFIRCARPTPKSAFYFPGEIEDFIRQTEEDPAFWTKVRRDAYLQCARLRDKRRKPRRGV